MTTSLFARLVLALAFAPLAGVALADPVSTAPTDADWARFGAQVDTNTFIVGHPASPRWVATHANHEHPAVLQARLARESATPIDANTFLVQPPASVTWLAASDAPQVTTVAGR